MEGLRLETRTITKKNQVIDVDEIPQRLDHNRSIEDSGSNVLHEFALRLNDYQPRFAISR